MYIEISVIVFFIISCHPATTREVSLLVIGSNLAIKDKVIKYYIKLLEGKISPSPSEKVKAKSGLWKGQRNGDRRFHADLTGLIWPMGTNHKIGGSKDRLVYPGNVPTCSRCHQKASSCPGREYASRSKQELI